MLSLASMPAQVVFSIDPERDVLPLYGATGEFLSAGNYGCVVRARLSKGWKMVALKISYHSSLLPDSVNPVFEYQILRDVMGISGDPFVLNAEEIVQIPLAFVTEDVLKRLVPHHCVKLLERIRFEKASRTLEEQSQQCHLYVTQMDLADGDMNHFLRNSPVFSAEEVRSLSFSMAYQMHLLQCNLGIKHRDLSLANVFYKSYDPTIHQAVYHFDVNGNKWTMRLGKGGLVCIPIIGDFGISETPTRITNMKNWHVTPVTGLLGPLEATEKTERGYEVDLWAFGLILFSLCTSNMPLGRYSGLGGIEEARPDTYDSTSLIDSMFSNKYLFSAAESLVHSTTKSLVGTSPYYTTVSDTTKRLGISEARLCTVMAVCLLQQALGNSFLPPDEELPQKTRGELYRGIEARQKEIEDALKSKPLTVSGSDHFFTYAVNYVRDTHGQEVIDLIRKCLSWSPEERKILSSPANAQEGTKLFFAVLKHPYFSEMGQNASAVFRTRGIVDPETIPSSESTAPIDDWRIRAVSGHLEHEGVKLKTITVKAGTILYRGITDAKLKPSSLSEQPRFFASFAVAYGYSQVDPHAPDLLGRGAIYCYRCKKDMTFIDMSHGETVEYMQRFIPKIKLHAFPSLRPFHVYDGKHGEREVSRTSGYDVDYVIIANICADTLGKRVAPGWAIYQLHNFHDELAICDPGDNLEMIPGLFRQHPTHARAMLWQRFDDSGKRIISETISIDVWTQFSDSARSMHLKDVTHGINTKTVKDPDTKSETARWHDIRDEWKTETALVSIDPSSVPENEWIVKGGEDVDFASTQYILVVYLKSGEKVSHHASHVREVVTKLAGNLSVDYVHSLDKTNARTYGDDDEYLEGFEETRHGKDAHIYVSYYITHPFILGRGRVDEDSVEIERCLRVNLAGNGKFAQIGKIYEALRGQPYVEDVFVEM